MVTEVTTKTTRATPSNIKEQSVNINTGEYSSRDYQSGLSGEKVTTSTKNYNSDGHLTSSESVETGSIGEQASTGSGDGEGEGEGQGTFCEYATEVCDFIGWFKGDDFEAPQHGEVPHEEIDVSTLESSWSSGLSSGSCPAGETITLMNDKTFKRDYTAACDAVSSVFKPILLFVVLIWSGFIIAGVRT
mgnify:CR=1 FL=1